MNLKVNITLHDELADSVVESTGSLDLASGDIGNVRYRDWDVAALGVPAARADYEFTSGVLSNDGKDVEFSVKVDAFGGYSVSPTELLELKVRAAKLFADIEGKDLLAGGRRELH